jgi:hypothetical protein
MIESSWSIIATCNDPNKKKEAVKKTVWSVRAHICKLDSVTYRKSIITFPIFLLQYTLLAHLEPLHVPNYFQRNLIIPNFIIEIWNKMRGFTWLLSHTLEILYFSFILCVWNFFTLFHHHNKKYIHRFLHVSVYWFIIRHLTCFTTKTYERQHFSETQGTQ